MSTAEKTDNEHEAMSTPQKLPLVKEFPHQAAAAGALLSVVLWCQAMEWTEEEFVSWTRACWRISAKKKKGRKR